MTKLISYIYAFLTDGTGLILMLLPIYIFARLVYLSLNPAKGLEKRLRPDREVLCLAFFLFLTMLFTQTFVENCGRNELRLIPFEVIITQTAGVNGDEASKGAFLFNIIGNVGIFVPVGLLAAAIFRRKAAGTAAIGFLISLTIEAGQLPLDRTSDVDDLILNTTGAAIGYLVYRMISSIHS